MSEENTSAVSFFGLVVMVVAVAFGGYLLIPNDREMTGRLMEDGKYDMALDVLESMSPEEKAANPEFYQTTKMRLQRMLADVGDQALVKKLLEEAVDAYRRLGEKAGELFAEVIKILQMMTDASGALAIVEPAVADLPVASRTELYRTLSELALARESPELAAEIFSRYLLDNLNDPNAVWESARLWRMAAKPDEALEAIETYSIANVTNLFREDQRLFILRMQVLREVSRAGEAFAALSVALDGKDRFGVEPETAEDELSELYIRTGIETEKGTEVLPFIEAYVQRRPDNLKLLEELAVIYVQATRFAEAIEIYTRLIEKLPAEANRLKGTLAQVYEWNEQVGEAYNIYLEIASAEQPDALGRLLSLHRPLYRTQEFEPVLQRVLPIDGRDELILEHARVLTRLGRYDLSLERYRDYLKLKPDDAAAVVEQADLSFASFYYDQAEGLYRRAIELLPDEVRLYKRLAESLYLNSQYEEAFDFYKEQLESGRHIDLEMVESFSRLAQSLGRYDEVSSGLEKVLELKGNPAKEDFLSLARTYYYQKDFGQQSSVLERALTDFPDDASVVYFLGLSYSAQRSYLKASGMIEANPKSLEDPKVFQLYLEILVANQDYPKALEIATGALDGAAFESTAMRLNLAHIYEGNQKYSDAREVLAGLYAEDPNGQSVGLAYANVLNVLGQKSEAKKVLAPFLESPTPDVLKMAAAISANSGEFDLAEEYQMAYLDAAEEPSFYDFGFLGDIRLELGEPNQAKEDYEVSLLRMLNEVVPELEEKEH